MRRVATHTRALLGSVLALGLLAPSAWSRVVQDAPTAPTAPAQADALAEARAALRAGTVDALEMPMLAGTLLEAGDLETVRELLVSGRDDVILAILAAFNSRRDVVLVDEVLGLAAQETSAEVQRKALDNLRRMACSDAEVRRRLVAELTTGACSEAEALAIIVVLGGCRDLSMVVPLLAQLDESAARALAAHKALVGLTGFDPPRPADAEIWRTFWERNAGRTREELMEAALDREREQYRNETERLRSALRALVAEVEQARIDRMGTDDVERLRAALRDDYARVRAAAAQRLESHPDPERAASAIPALLARLGVASSEGTNGHEAEQESDPAVRAAVVSALGAMGRNRPEVLSALIAELASPHGGVGSAAVRALSKVRGSPSVVRPLLDLLDRGVVDEDTTKLVLSIIAENRPSGVLPDLERHLAAAPSVGVQSGVARALLACEELDAALDLVEPLAEPGAHVDVRFGLADGLGRRSSELKDQPTLRARMVSILARLVADPSPSVRAEAASALGESGDPGALSVLEPRLEVETDPTVAQRLVRSLGELKSLDGVDTIGRKAAGKPSSDPVWEEARRALLSICSDSSGAELWTAAQTLDQVRADQLALVVLELLIAPTKPIPGQGTQFVPQALALKAELLLRTGQVQAAHDLLLTIHEQPDAAYPDPVRRVTLLADTAEQLGRFEEAAGYHEQRRALLPPGDARLGDVCRRLAEDLWRAGLSERALVEVEALHASEPEDNAIMFRLAELHMALGGDQVARDLLARLRPRIPETPDGAELRGRVEEALQLLGPAPEVVEPVPPTEPGAESDAANPDETDAGADS